MEKARRTDSLTEQTKKKVWGPVTKELLTVFRKYSDSEEHLHVSNLRAACNALNLYPSTSQVHEMLTCAIEYGSPCKPDHITFGEFCVLVSELRSYYQINPKPPYLHCVVKVRSEHGNYKRKRRENLAHFQVFLGGSCNPTKWRAEIAIPYFKEHGITFYNPNGFYNAMEMQGAHIDQQVQHWSPALMELETQAKQMVDVLFFVISNKTRAISSMIEVAYLVATHRQVVMVVCDIKQDTMEVNGHKLTDNEMHDLIKGRLILIDLVERNSVPIFHDIQKALNCTRIIITQNKHVSELTLKDGALPVQHGHLKLGRAVLELREAFNSVDSGNSTYLTSQDVCLAYKSCTGDVFDKSWLRQHRKSQDQFLYEEFCAIVTEYKAHNMTTSFLQKIFSHIYQPFHWLIAKFSPPVGVEEDHTEEIRDVYLGGSTGDIQWRSEISVPILRKHGLSFVDTELHNWDQKLIPIHVALREHCRLLFYVISSDRRSLGSMCEAGYYIGKGCRMVLCIQKLAEKAVIHGEPLTDSAIADYNRGRDYLGDLANQEGVPLFNDIREATMCVVSILSEQQGRSSGQGTPLTPHPSKRFSISPPENF